MLTKWGGRLFLTFRRWRHSNGYGVHSPCVYRLVKLALNPKRGYVYYGYSDIEETLSSGEPGGRIKRKDARLLLRLIVSCNAGRVVVETVPPVWMAAACSAAGVGISIASECTPESRDILLLRGDEGVVCAGRWLQSRATVISFDPGKVLRKALGTERTCGFLVDGKRIMISSGRDGMAFVKYDMKF